MTEKKINKNDEIYAERFALWRDSFDSMTSELDGKLERIHKEHKGTIRSALNVQLAVLSAQIKAMSILYDSGKAMLDEYEEVAKLRESNAKNAAKPAKKPAKSAKSAAKTASGARRAPCPANPPTGPSGAKNRVEGKRTPRKKGQS